jgi:hypothetical protein
VAHLHRVEDGKWYVGIEFESFHLPGIHEYPHLPRTT